ncbi:TetR/AcrR family transcriptional regulator [Streptomyces albidoflavus]|uniref:TetR/AcrR family transcriptional regulator n=1 Tax=Streptomyces albidoflavus TaxID=1886 RepID=UPI00101E2D93|nr:TetR/AcrR family transcriptional regulator [Streptomyces albidoflavus]RZD87323.1 TetR family transcriptional regulator [Streptomyces albidoflavus]RZE03367.1 TetR family transcriptional regulator [Streptomyces albidoflavus]RZE11775.1 TetR family transcriptional regulator [Streptomyces albidoflavus]RZE65272.1 TetR family transcriptional regulator [Streptomyces albidoflavus]
MGAHAGLTVDRITQAAAVLADEVGIEKVTISALAREFGVRDASFYSHVKNLQEIRTRVAILASEEMSERIATAIAGRSGGDALAAFADAYRQFALEYPGRYAATQLRLNPADLAETTAFARSVELTYAVMRYYGLDEPDLTDAARLLRSTFHGYISIEATGGFNHPRDVEASWRQAIKGLHLLLEQWPRTKSV